MAKNIIELNDAQFDMAVAKGVTLVDFWAPWCGPCRIQTPILEALATELEGRVRFAKVNVDDHQTMAGRYGVQAIPTLILFKDGKPVNQFIGLQRKETLTQAMQTALQAAA